MAASTETSTTDQHEGYSTSIFPHGSFDTKFTCNLCNCILRDPVQSFCGHRFCKKCIVAVLQSRDKVYCHACRTEGTIDDDFSIISQDQLFPDNAIRREMNGINVVCINEGCNWTGTFKQYQEHYRNCTKRLERCPHCGHEIAMDLIQKHIQDDCKSNKIICAVGCDAMNRPSFISHLQTNPGIHINYLIEKVCVLEQQVNRLVSGATSADTIATINSFISDLQHKVTGLGQRLDSVHPGAVDQNRQQIAGGLQTLIQQCQRLQLSTGTYESIATTMHRELERCITSIEAIERNRHSEQEKMVENERKIKHLERTIALKDITLAEHHIRLDIMETTGYDGNLTWRIDEWSKKRESAIRGQVTSVSSPVFYTDRCGYKMRVNLYPNGDGVGKAEYVSLFLGVMKGQHDAILKWPFLPNVTLNLMDQNGANHISQSFKPEPKNNAFIRPTNEMNVQSGIPKFVNLEHLTNSYIKDDTMFIKVNVDLGSCKSMIYDNLQT